MQRLSLQTGGVGPIVVLSTEPSLAGNMPDDAHRAETEGARDIMTPRRSRDRAAPTEADRPPHSRRPTDLSSPPPRAGGLIALIGQAPVRCRGRVSAGDALVPSGRHDGCAVSAGDASAVAAGALARAGGVVPATIGTALEGRASSRGAEEPNGAEEEEGLVNCLVRWDDPLQARRALFFPRLSGGGRRDRGGQTVSNCGTAAPRQRTIIAVLLGELGAERSARQASEAAERALRKASEDVAHVYARALRASEDAERSARAASEDLASARAAREEALILSKEQAAALSARANTAAVARGSSKEHAAVPCARADAAAADAPAAARGGGSSGAWSRASDVSARGRKLALGLFGAYACRAGARFEWVRVCLLGAAARSDEATAAGGGAPQAEAAIAPLIPPPVAATTAVAR